MVAPPVVEVAAVVEEGGKVDRAMEHGLVDARGAIRYAPTGLGPRAKSRSR